MRIAELAWIDGFYRRVRPWLFVREEDRVLILPPSRVYRLNESGLALLGWLGRGRKIARFPGLAGAASRLRVAGAEDGAAPDGAGERVRQVHEFFCDLRALFQGCAGSGGEGRRAIERVPYTFDFTRLPVLGEIAVTWRCNQRCLFCYAGCGPRPDCGPAASAPPAGPPERAARAPAGEAAEMGLAEVRRVLRIFREEARLPFFSFTGGEPLLRDDLEAMIRDAVRLGLRVNLITNGTLAHPARARRLRRAGLRTAQVSLESAREQTHDRLTRTPGSWRAALEGIRRLREAGIDVQTNTTLTRLNADGAAELPELLARIGVRRFSTNLFIPAGRGLEHGELFLPYRQVPPLIERLRQEARRLGLDYSWYSPIPHCLYNPVARGLGNKSCAAVDGLLSVSPSGAVLPCSSWPEPIGDLLRQPFEAVWFSARARHFKEKRYAPAACAGCQRFTACQAACPLYWAYAGTAEIVEARARGGAP